MRNTNGLILFITSVLLLLLLPDRLYPQQLFKTDSSFIEVRRIDQVKLTEYRGQKEFMYDLQKGRNVGFWEQLRYWFWEQYHQLMEKPGFRIGFRVLIWSLSIGIMLYAIVRMIGMDKVKLWIRGEKSGALGYNIEPDDIYGIDFDPAIENAVRQKQFREAIRLLYLKSLRKLSDRELIQWTQNKTNIDYALELSSTPYSAEFNRITRFYEYAWYGEFEVNEDEYSRISPFFNHFNKLLKV